MKKIGWVIGMVILCGSCLFANDDIEKLKRRVKIMAPNTIGWCSEEKAIALLELILEVNPKIVVEIGVFGGSSFLPMACGVKYLKSGVIYAVDPWNNIECIKHLDSVEDKEHIDWWRSVRLLDVYGNFLDKLILYDYECCSVILKKTAEDAANDIGAIDILHIDGHRSEEVSALDVKLYLPKVNPGGYIWLGDTLSFYKQKAVEMLLKECDVVKVIDNGNCILFKKKVNL